jgi:biotin carboxyl carrier protein
MKKVGLEIDGQRVEGTVAYSQGVLWVHMGGQTFTVDSAKRSRRGGGRGGAAGAHPGEIPAPMPGKIIKILVQKGERVAAQQVMLVMEAMKMEYTLKAQAEGAVGEISCEAGQQVTLGQVLIKLELK